MELFIPVEEECIEDALPKDFVSQSVSSFKYCFN